MVRHGSLACARHGTFSNHSNEFPVVRSDAPLKAAVRIHARETFACGLAAGGGGGVTVAVVDGLSAEGGGSRSGGGFSEK